MFDIQYLSKFEGRRKMDIMHIEIKLEKGAKINLLYQDKFSGFALQDTIF